MSLLIGKELEMMECKMLQLLWKTVCLFLKKQNEQTKTPHIESLQDAAIPSLGLYPEDLKQGFKEIFFAHVPSSQKPEATHSCTEG